jgi:hypothetical protein
MPHGVPRIFFDVYFDILHVERNIAHGYGGQYLYVLWKMSVRVENGVPRVTCLLRMYVAKTVTNCELRVTFLLRMCPPKTVMNGELCTTCLLRMCPPKLRYFSDICMTWVGTESHDTLPQMDPVNNSRWARNNAGTGLILGNPIKWENFCETMSATKPTCFCVFSLRCKRDSLHGLHSWRNRQSGQCGLIDCYAV